MKGWGWTGAILATTTWFYSVTFTYVRDLQPGLTAGSAFFMLFFTFAVFSSTYLWRKLRLFWAGAVPAA